MGLNMKQLFDAEPASVLYVAINRVLVNTAECLVMVEWERLHDAQGNMLHVNVKPDIVFVHGSRSIE